MIAKTELKARRARILEEKGYLTSRMSESCRYIGFGLLAIFYTIRSAGPDNTFANSLITQHPTLVFLVGMFGAAAVLLDFLQYFFGQRAVEVALKRSTIDYDPESCSYKARSLCYWAKQLAVGAGSTVLIFLVAIA